MRLLAAISTALLLGLGSPWVRAAVVEPNNIEVPTVPTGNEEGLQAFFTRIGEPINALQEAQANPGTFSPRCDFSITLVLNESGAQAGLAWYNVPEDPNAAPATFYPIFPEGTPVNTVIDSASIRTSPDYVQGGMIGFVLTKTLGGTMPQPIYYSEYQRNRNCTSCVNPGHWVMALAFAAKNEANTYYIAFEDWEGADNTTWHGNDGDFNDKVFRITGVSCLGGGAPCDTGKPGLCGPGLTECQPGGTLACKQQVPETDEQCDSVDNDCDGEVDEGELCGAFEVCLRGRCVPSCNSDEFQCPIGQVCEGGYCVESACQGVTCDEGQVCRGGVCGGACDGVVCPLGQQCVPGIGVCLDPCAGVECVGAVCQDGVCVATCDCQGCSSDKACGASGACVEPGCEMITCAPGQVCQAGGVCADICEGAICPGGAQCVAGVCGEPVGGGGNSGTGGGLGSGGLIIGSGGGSPGTGASSGNGNSSGNSGNGANSGAGDGGSGTIGESDGGCGCRTTGRNTRSGAFALFLLALLARRRRQRR